MTPEFQFFPSRTLSWYMAKAFLIRSAAVLAALVIVLQTLDLLGESGDILAYQGNGDAQLWHYVALRLPQIIARFLPFSVLLGTLITLVTLNQNSEVIAMKAGGVSAHQILAPLVIASMGIAVLSFTFNERIVTRATATLNAWQDVNYGPAPKGRGIPTNVWVRDGDDIVHADQAESILQEGRADLVALAREILYNPNWPMDAAQKLGADPDFALVPSQYSYWLGKRAKSAFEGKPSTWSSGRPI